MAKTKKKVLVKTTVAEKAPVKVGVAKKVLKRVSYGAGVLIRKVRKAGKVVSPKVWGDAKRSILNVLKLARKPQVQEKPLVSAADHLSISAGKKKSVVKKTRRKAARKTVPVVLAKDQPEAV